MAGTSETYKTDALISIKNLANAPIEDCKTMKTLADTNAELVKKVAQLTENLAASLKRKCTGEKNRHPKIHYYWTNGAKCNHTSKKCRFKKQGHKDEATADNKRGGEN